MENITYLLGMLWFSVGMISFRENRVKLFHNKSLSTSSCDLETPDFVQLLNDNNLANIAVGFCKNTISKIDLEMASDRRL